MKDLVARYGAWALVTGASSGLGEEYAHLLAARGFSVAIVARRAEKLQGVAEKLRAQHHVAVRILAEDLADTASVGRIVTALEDVEVGVLVNNAGFGFSGSFADHDMERDLRIIDVNCRAVVALTHAFLPQMMARRRGAIVILSSLAGFQPTPWFAIYGATKAFDLMFAEALWSELRGSGVDVLAVCPGSTKTEFSIHAHFNRPPDGADPRKVALDSLAHLGRGPSWVPGLTNKFSAFLHRLLPRGFVANATGSVLARELLKTTPANLRSRRD